MEQQRMRTRLPRLAMPIVGFGAVLFTYFGNPYFGELHSYAGLN